MLPKESRLITQAVILAAGLGTRLRPLTDSCPKPMVPICGTPLLERTVMHLKGQGYADFVMNLYHFPKTITDHFGDGARFGVSVRYSDETRELMNTGGALRKMSTMLDDDFLFMYGDELHRFDFAPIVKLHQERRALATIVLKRGRSPRSGEVARIDSYGRFLEWHARPHEIMEFGEGQYVNSGLYVLSKRILDYIPEGVAINLDKEAIPAALAAGESIFGVPTDEPIIDIGTHEGYRRAEEWLMEKGEV